MLIDLLYVVRWGVTVILFKMCLWVLDLSIKIGSGRDYARLAGSIILGY